MSMEDTYYFIHYIEISYPPSEPEDCISLNGTGYLYIGSADWDPAFNGHQEKENTFFHIEDARRALKAIAKALHLP